MTASAVDPAAFPIEHASLPEGMRIAYVHAGQGGYPLLLIHGYPETKRIWWRNVEPLAERGFEVIAPDLRGFGGSALDPDGQYDPAAFAGDLHTLLCEVLGHERCATVAGDLGAVVAIELALRFTGVVERQVIFAAPLPALEDRYRKAGIPRDPPLRSRPESDYFLRQGLEADQLIDELASSEQRLDYVASFYRERGWAGREGFSAEEARFMAEPFAERERLRASWIPYEVAMGVRSPSERPCWDRPCAVPTLALYGEEDGVVRSSFTEKAKVAFPECVGPFVVPRCGHFVQWEQAEMLNRAVGEFIQGP